LTYKLQTVISDGNYHTIISPGIETSFEVVENQLIYTKVPVDGSYSPCTL